MTRVKRVVSSLLLAAGLLLVFAGLSAALGFSLVGVVGSVGAIAALLYAGSVWFGAPAAPPPTPHVLVFDATLTLVSGAPVLEQFPEAERAHVRARCLAALAGERVQFAAGARRFDATPLVGGDGAVLYAALIERSAVPRPAAGPAVHADVTVR